MLAPSWPGRSVLAFASALVTVALGAGPASAAEVSCLSGDPLELEEPVANIPFDLLEQRFHLRIVGVVYTHGNAPPARG